MTGRENNRQIGENPAPDRCERCGWIDELLDDQGGEGTTDRRAFEEGMKAAARLGRAISDLEDPDRRNDERIAEVIDATAAFYAQFVHVGVNYELRIALLEDRGGSGDGARAAALRHHRGTKLDELNDEVEDHVKVERLKRIVRSTMRTAKTALDIGAKLGGGV